MVLLNLVKKIASDVNGVKIDFADLKMRMTKVEKRLDEHIEIFKHNNLH
jgi:hypothetical protein